MLKPVGGPAGYLFNLRQGLDTLNKEELPIDVSFYEAAPKSLRDTVKNKDKIPKRLREFRRAVDDIFYKKKAYPLDEKLHQYDMIHFHSIDAMYLCRKTLENYKGTVILTSHSPCAKFKERRMSNRYSDDAHIWKIIEIIENKNFNINKLSKLQLILQEYLSLLLKWDWERSKREVRGEKAGVIQLILWIISVVIYATGHFYEYIIESKVVDIVIIGENILRC